MEKKIITNRSEPIPEWEDYRGEEALEMKHGFELYLRPGCEYSRVRYQYRIAESNELDWLKRECLKILCVLMWVQTLVTGRNFLFKSQMLQPFMRLSQIQLHMKF